MPFSEGGYGVSHGEVVSFVKANVFVARWLEKYVSGPRSEFSGSKLNKARILCRFFKWLRIVKGLYLEPNKLLDLQLQKRKSSSVEERQWLLSLVLEHSRDNPDFKSYSDMRKYDVFNTVKGFFDYYEVPLTTGNNIYGKKRKRKNHRKQITLVDAKKILGEMSQRDRTINLIQLQSGMGIGEVLNKFNYMWHSQVKSQLDNDRMKIEFDERKGNGTWYFTFASSDAIHELRKWLQERQRIIEKLLGEGKTLSKPLIDGEPIFITMRGTPLRENQFLRQFNQKMQGKVTTHMFRKLFESEAKVPDRAIDRGTIKFFMGHITDLDDVGGIYDRNPEIREEIFEKEYAKLEPYINIYSGARAVLTEDDREILALLREPEVREWFRAKLKEDKII